jgi:LysM repeat protein
MSSTPPPHRIEREEEKRSMAIHPAINKALLLFFSLSLAAIALTATTAAIAHEGRVDLNLIQPPPPNQGGTCLTGFIVDRYYQPAGAGWDIQITSSEGKILTQPADDQGRFAFDELSSGPWEVALQLPDEWQAFTPAVFPITLSGAGENCAKVRFQVESMACLQVRQLVGLPDTAPDDLPGISGWLMTASNDSQVMTGTTDDQGQVTFTNLKPGSWTVSGEERNGWQPVEGYADIQSIDLLSPRQPGECQQIDFQSQPLFACVDVYQVDSRDGSGLAGWEISIEPKENGLTIADITDGTGWVRFSELTPGTYTIAERPQDGWTAETPVSTTVQLEAGASCTQVRFENRSETSPSQLESAPEAKPKEKAGKSTCRVNYRVRAGDTLLRISRRNDIGLVRLLKFNPIANPNLIYPGQVICIPR